MNQVKSGIFAVTRVAKQAYNAASPAVKTTQEKVVEEYKKMMHRNADYVVRDPKAADKLLKQWFFTNLSRIPAVAEGVQKEAGVLKGNIAELPKTLGRGEVSLAEVGIWLGFTAELYAWFCVGEIAGRGLTVTGYSLE